MIRHRRVRFASIALSLAVVALAACSAPIEEEDEEAAASEQNATAGQLTYADRVDHCSYQVNKALPFAWWKRRETVQQDRDEHLAKCIACLDENAPIGKCSASTMVATSQFRYHVAGRLKWQCEEYTGFDLENGERFTPELSTDCSANDQVCRSSVVEGTRRVQCVDP